MGEKGIDNTVKDTEKPCTNLSSNVVGRMQEVEEGKKEEERLVAHTHILSNKLEDGNTSEILRNEVLRKHGEIETADFFAKLKNAQPR